MSARVIARSISRPVGERLRQGPLPPARVLAAFEHACNLVTAEGDVIALVSPQVGDGPLNVVIEGGGGLSAIEPGTPACLGRERLQVGGMEIALHPAATWEPRPDWEKLRLQRATCAHRLPLLRELCLRHASPGSLLDPVPGGANAVASATWATAQSATRHLQAGWQGDTARLQAGASQLAGLGGGLTPAGDDFLAGAVLGGWLAHPEPDLLGHRLVETAAPRTTTLSAAFLRAAGRGECDTTWHALLAALVRGSDAALEQAAKHILARGATSGADTLAGFMICQSWLNSD